MRQEVVQLRCTSIEDLEFVIRAEREPENSAFIRQWTEREHCTAIEDDGILHLIVEAMSDGHSVGYVILCGLGNSDRSIEFKRIVVCEKGRGLGRDAVRAVEALAFETLGAHRLWLEVVARNSRAKHLYETERFVAEGTLREAAKIEGRFESLIVMAMLESEYTVSVET